jgi:hypothetical protein
MQPSSKIDDGQKEIYHATAPINAAVVFQLKPELIRYSANDSRWE